MKPMYPEDACVEMELLGHDFYVFINAETEDVNVVYKRKGNTCLLYTSRTHDSSSLVQASIIVDI